MGRTREGIQSQSKEVSEKRMNKHLLIEIHSIFFVFLNSERVSSRLTKELKSVVPYNEFYSEFDLEEHMRKFTRITR